MNKSTPTGRTFRIMGHDVKEVTTEPCKRVHQYMSEQPITCACSRCKVDNAGLSQAEIIARMDKVYQ